MTKKSACVCCKFYLCNSAFTVDWLWPMTTPYAMQEKQLSQNDNFLG